jgi:Bacterial Ig domain/6-bladed beta-propeller
MSTTSPMPTSRRAILAALAALSLLTAVLAPVLPARPAAAAWSQPAFVQSIGGTGKAGIYAWGLDYNPVANEVIVSDYQSFRARRYSPAGKWLGDLPDFPGETWAVASDPITGDTYVTDNWRKQVHRYARNGTWIKTWSTAGQRYAVWLDVDNAGDVWIVDSADGSAAANVKVNRYNKDGVREAQWTVTVPFPKVPTLYGIGVTASGHVFLPDGNNQRIHLFTGAGRYLWSAGSEGAGLGGLSRDIRSVALDEPRQALYVSDAGSNQIEKFSYGGTPLAQWGGLDNSENAIQAPRQLSVDPAGNVWAADYGNHRFRKYSPTGAQLAVFPDPDDSESPGHFGQARDVDVDPVTGDVWVVDTANQHFTRMSANGAFRRVLGRRGFGDYGMNYPSAIAFEPKNRAVWVANEEGRYIKVYGADGTFRFMIGQQAKTPESRGLMMNPTDIDFSGNRAYVSDEQNTKMQIFDVDNGAKVGEFAVAAAPWSYVHGQGIDPTNGWHYVANNKDDRIDVYDANGVKQRSFGGPGSGNGQFMFPRDAAVVGGLVYVTDSEVRRVQVFDRAGTFLGKWGGRGMGPYQFEKPTGITSDPQGRIYVTDMDLNRVLVYDTKRAKPPFESVAPRVTVSGPTDGQVLAGGPVHVTGTATDNAAVAGVEVAVQNTVTGKWFNGMVASWETAQTWNVAPIVSTGRPATSATFDFSFPNVVYGGRYRVEVRARDAATATGNLSATVARAFSLS